MLGFTAHSRLQQWGQSGVFARLWHEVPGDLRRLSWAEFCVEKPRRFAAQSAVESTLNGAAQPLAVLGEVGREQFI